MFKRTLNQISKRVSLMSMFESSVKKDEDEQDSGKRSNKSASPKSSKAKVSFAESVEHSKDSSNGSSKEKSLGREKDVDRVIEDDGFEEKEQTIYRIYSAHKKERKYRPKK